MNYFFQGNDNKNTGNQVVIVATSTDGNAYAAQNQTFVNHGGRGVQQGNNLIQVNTFDSGSGVTTTTYTTDPDKKKNKNSGVVTHNYFY